MQHPSAIPGLPSRPGGFQVAAGAPYAHHARRARQTRVHQVGQPMSDAMVPAFTTRAVGMPRAAPRYVLLT
jgi:hypothetical protein